MRKISKLFITFTASFISLTASAGISIKLPWNKAEISVCFAGKGTTTRLENVEKGFADWKDDQMDLIQKALESEYTLERTGYAFVGFQRCQKNEKMDVVILRKPTTSPYAFKAAATATVGVQGIPPVKDYSHARGLVVFTSSGLNKTAIVHEFGHVIGLKHEHEHPEAYNEAQTRCRFYNKKNVINDNFIYTKFDEGSVMNYCTNLADKNSGLSLGDIEVIQALYQKANLN